MNKKRKLGVFSAKNVAALGVLTALVLILQMGLGSIVVGSTSFSLVLIPIVLGALVIGPWAGALLGFIFSLIVFIYGLVGIDPFTNVMINANWWATALICFGKGILAGLMPGLIYKALKDKNYVLGVILASLSAPIVNTGIFVGGTLIFRGLFENAFVKNEFFTDASQYVYFIVIVCAGVNFLVEFGINTVLIPAVHAIVKVVSNRFNKDKKAQSTDETAE